MVFYEFLALTMIAAPYLTYHVVPCHFPIYIIIWQVINAWSYYVMNRLRRKSNKYFGYHEHSSFIRFPLHRRYGLRTLPFPVRNINDRTIFNHFEEISHLMLIKPMFLINNSGKDFEDGFSLYSFCRLLYSQALCSSFCPWN